VLGLLDLRGRVVPVLDLRRRLGLSPAAPGLSTPICVAEAGGGGGGFGLVADAVTDVRPLEGPVEPLAGAPGGGPVAGVAHVDGRLVSVLAPARLAAGWVPPPAARTEPVEAGR
jgi:purine-binding chemotaxis protein CheW